uniref:RING-type E3 ubiquitin transferase n=1 Tax=Rhizophora mucronata TaxID=61149 RepID=A0A2P2IRG4_RHIMU
MKSVSVAVLVWALSGSLLCGCAVSYMPDSFSFGATGVSSGTYSYDRIDEVKKHCASVISSATELKPDDNRMSNIKENLNFVNGDWRQDPGKAPILPYLHRENQSSNLLHPLTPLTLASFWVSDVDHVHRSKKLVDLNGLLVMGITLNSFGEKIYDRNPQFQMWPDHVQLSMLFEGIYTESKKNGGQRVICLLGSAMLPSRESDSGDPWEWLKGSGSNYNVQPPLLQDDQILLVLRYPMSLSLTNRLIQGELRSLNPKSNPKYFDAVYIISQLGKLVNYEFGSERFVSKACDPYPYHDNLLNSGIDTYQGRGFCEILQQITGEGAGPFNIVPNWRCNGTNDFCTKMGPFSSDEEIKATNGSFKGVKLLLQNVKCEQVPERGNASSSNVAAVFRVVPPGESLYTAAMRSGLNNMTVVVEGTWKSSSGQLCMIGCWGMVDTEGNSCDSRICLYIPLSFSISQRSIILGSFTSTDKNHASYFPLSFEKILEPTELWNYFTTSHPYYRYTKIEKAGIILEENEPFSFRTVIKKSLLKYPKLDDTVALTTSLSLLAEDLTLQIPAFPDPFPSSRTRGLNFQMMIVSLGPLFVRYWSLHNSSSIDEKIRTLNNAELTERQLLMNVSAQITIDAEAYSNFSVLFLEGLYDAHVGRMYLVGCRDVRASQNILFESMDLEAGLDCLIEVIVSYPPTTAQWLVNPTARISISSQRNDDDPLRFSTVKLQTLPILYRRQREDILSQTGIEGILRILTLSFAIACISSQLFYIKHDVDSVPFISLVMLGVQAVGYSLPLITGAEALFKRMSSEPSEMSSYGLETNQWFHAIDYTVKFLVLVSFLLTLRLCQKVWKSRIRFLTRSPHEPHRVPTDKRVFLFTLTIHVIGYVIVLIFHSIQTSQRPLRLEEYVDFVGHSHTLREWETELEEYVGLVQDFFLLPQVIGNLIWQIDCKPLRKLYFIGITVVRLLPHIYDYLRAPVRNPFFSNDYEFVNPNTDFYSKFGDIVIPVTAAFLAAAVYVQQRWNYEKLSQTLSMGHHRLLPFKSRMYERLPSKSPEMELALGVNGSDRFETEHNNEE